jgi:hypothetical protein
MRNLIRFVLGFSLLALIAFCGCKADPQPDIKAAQRALDKARDYHSEVLAPAEWKEALQAWEEAEAALKKGDASIPHFQKAKTLFEKTIKASQGNGLAMGKEIDEVQNDINDRYMKLKATLEKGKIKPKIMKELKPILDEVSIDSSAVKDLIMQFDYPQAREKVLATREKMHNAEIVMAGQKTSR